MSAAICSFLCVWLVVNGNLIATLSLSGDIFAPHHNTSFLINYLASALALMEIVWSIFYFARRLFVFRVSEKRKTDNRFFQVFLECINVSDVCGLSGKLLPKEQYLQHVAVAG